MKKRNIIVILTVIMTLTSGILVNAAVFNVKQSPDSFSVNGVPIRQNPSDGVFLLDTTNHRSYLPISSVLKATGAKLTQTLKADGSSNWDFSLPTKVEDVAGGFIIKVSETSTNADGFAKITFNIVSKDMQSDFTATVDVSKGLDMTKRLPVGANYMMFESEGQFVIIDALGEMQRLTMIW
jgi:hypothetical protein